MAMNIATNRTVDFALRALQLIFAIVILGIDGYAIHVYRGHTVYVHFVYGNFYAYQGVPDAWSFLLFCAAWTVLSVIFHLIPGISYTDHGVIDYIGVAVEAVALLSWLAGFVAVSVNIGSNACPAEENGCGTLIAGTVFGAVEWLLFMITAALTIKLVFKGPRRSRASKPEKSSTSPATAMASAA
ncbi:hypothetical protein BO71DRAFT_442186 [Aspergillus ellipticus CBS 707.79]|uniref:MARVEL domain-containing protein n=1 Tax=Aspergillus ellipticus CBS 707.79 TaxID=1448320 RepID=A0A319DX93_9EURO|nr:hypothetical protein BO71DRAFT_442186 [Aspergillus ellipticus CBS 707.79]